MTIEKPSDGCADEVLQGAWPDFDEDLFKHAADAEFQDARIWADDATKSTHEVKNYATQEMEGRAAEAIEQKMHVHLGECAETATAHANVAGFLLMGQAAIMAAKSAMKSAVAEHVPAHDALKIMIGGQGIKDADLQKARGLVAAARTQLETAIDAVRAGCEAHGLTAPPGGTPKIPVAPAEKGDVGVGNTPTAVPVKPPLGDPNSPANTNPGLTNPGAPAGTAPTAPTGSTPTGTGAASTPAATAAPTGTGAAPAAPAAGATPGADASAGVPAAAASPTGAGAGQQSPMGMSGMPMGGMPQGGMPQMQPPQMPSQTPGGDVAKTIGDTIGKVAGNNQGSQLPAGTLDKLLEAQKEPTGSAATAPVGEGGPNDGKDTAGTEHKPGEKTDGKTQTGTHTLGSGPKGSDVYSAENTNPALNNPGGGKPSPAVPTISAAPSGVSAPVTELSSDDTPLPPAGSATTLAGAGHHPGGGDSPATHTSSNSNPFTPDPRNPLAAPSQPPSAQGSLSAYSPGGLGPGMPIAPPPMSAGMGAAPAPAPAAPVLAAGGAPVLAMTPAAAAVLRNAAANSGKTTNLEDTGGVPRDRIAGLPAEHAVADMQLAGLMKSFASHGWAGTGIAVGVFLLEDPRPRLRYVVATSDGLSHLPIGVPAPAGVELLQHQKLNTGFASDWGGNWRAGLKLATYARSHRNCGELTYLVSNDTRDGILSPAKAGTVIEAVQTDAERTKLLEQGRVSAATMLRTQLHSPGFSDEALGKVPGWLEAFADQWGADPDAALESARARLWALRWDQRRGRDGEYPFVFVNYLILEGMKALAAGQIEEAAYVVDELVGIDHPTHLQYA